MAIVKIDIVIKFSGWISLRIQLTADALVFWLTSCACRYCLFLADMINGTKSPEDVAKATQDQFAQLAKAQGVQGF